MRTYLDLANGRSDPEAVGRTLTDTLMEARRTLPPTANNKPALLSDPYAMRVAQEMSKQRSQEFKRIYAVCQCLLIDGVSLPLVTAALKQMLTMLEVESVTFAAERRHAASHVLPSLLRRETRKQGHLDLAQLRVVETPECPNALHDVLHAGAEYLSAYMEWERACVGILHLIRHTRTMRVIR